MSKDRFPARIDPHRIFASGGEIQSEVSLERFSRLAGYLADNAGYASLNLQFNTDEEGRRRVTGTLESAVTLVCQRCLQNAVFTVQGKLDIHVVDSEEAAGLLPSELESVVCRNGPLDLAALVEDELILCLPLSPRHDDEQCNVHLTQLKQEGEARDKQAQTNNGPFSGLRKLTDKQT